MTDDRDILKEIQRVKNGVTLRSAFYSSLLMELEVVVSDEVPTAATDGLHLWVNPFYFIKLSFPKRMGLFAHEAHHCGANHHTRIGDRELELFNYAGDYAINLEVIRDGFELPDGALLDRRFDGMAVERIYNILDKEREQKNQNKQNPQSQSGNGESKQGAGQQPGQQPSQAGQPQPGQPQPGSPGPGSPGPAGKFDVGGCGSFMAPVAANGQPISKADLGRERAKWDSAVRLADSVERRMKKAIGNAPGRQKTMIQEQQFGTGDWHEEMRQFMWRCVTERYSWLQPDYRIDEPYIPSRQGRRIKEVVVGIDTSASVSKRQLRVVKGEFNLMLDEVNPMRVHVVFWDAQVQRFVTYEDTDYPVDFDFPGRGGTVLQSFMRWVEQNDISPDCAIIFTDMEIGDWGEEPDYPVLWGDLGKRGKAPYGVVLDLTEV